MISAEYEIFAMNQQDKVAVMEIQYQLVNEGGAGLISSFNNFITGLIKRIVDVITRPFKKKVLTIDNVIDKLKAFKTAQKVPIIDPNKVLDTAKQMVHDATMLSQKIIMTQDFNDTDKTLYDKIAAEVNTEKAISKKIQGMIGDKIYATKTVTLAEVVNINKKLVECNTKLVEIAKPAKKSMEAAKNKVTQISDEEKQKKFIGIQTILSRYVSIAISVPNSLFNLCIQMCNEAGENIIKEFEEQNPGVKITLRYTDTAGEK